MTLKAKSSDMDESSNDEDSKMKSYITRQFKMFMKNANMVLKTELGIEPFFKKISIQPRFLTGFLVFD